MEGICHCQKGVKADFCMVIFNIADMGGVAAYHFREIVLCQSFVLADFFYPETKIAIINFLTQ